MLAWFFVLKSTHILSSEHSSRYGPAGEASRPSAGPAQSARVNTYFLSRICRIFQVYLKSAHERATSCPRAGSLPKVYQLSGESKRPNGKSFPWSRTRRVHRKKIPAVRVYGDRTAELLPAASVAFLTRKSFFYSVFCSPHSVDIL